LEIVQAVAGRAERRGASVAVRAAQEGGDLARLVPRIRRWRGWRPLAGRASILG